MKTKIRTMKKGIAGMVKNTFFRETLELEFAVFLTIVLLICHLAFAATIQWAVMILR
ncbi:MAG TPA: hypothetical protein PL033_08340 [Candidatus Brocadiia bacterium]|nr:hypothetical protein [Candidatus Brocadiia bacterium]